MAESQPLLGRKSLTVQERDHHRQPYLTFTDGICQQGPTRAGNQQGPSTRHQAAWNGQSRGRANVLPPPSLNEDQAREALLSYISSTCCWSAGPAERMVIKDIVPSSTFSYKLETFMESRAIRTVSEPYEGRPIPLVTTRATPDPWEVTVRATSLFENSTQEVEIPNTVSIKSCHECYGKGFQECDECNGRGGDKCTMCNRGDSYRSRHRQIVIHHGHNRVNRNGGDCSFCNGSGRRQACSRCHGNGSTKCSTCKGTSQLRTSVKLTVTRINNTDFIAGEGTGIPLKLIKRARGQVVFEEELSRVNPITHFQDQSINNASSQLIAKHQFQPNKKIIRQRQSVNLVPISQVRCMYKGAPIHYFVYGFDNKVYAPDYPAQCCCTIL
ncbi:Protein SSUH2-like [Holothuria leucospilota]|uniref:Protein SSUH2-like n=1 Tax=Holothuria leucospilota TaxID=206669 RepID=A0A9Q1CJY2_HOLLE|nr:Protein SSUH2-like [Holothuria leucospilota]